MNYKLIEKLAKLANNNPNEHEANMAARKVCKLLAEGNFKFNESKIVSMETPPSSSSSSSIYDNFRDMMNNMRKEQEQHYTQQFYGNPFQEKKGNRTRVLECNKCHNRTSTLFQGMEFAFICNQCMGQK